MKITRKTLVIKGAIALFIFLISSCSRVPEIPPKDLAKQYIEKTMFLSEGYDACVEFTKGYGYTTDQKGQKVPVTEEMAKKFCNYRKNVDRYEKVKYEVKESNFKSNYKLILHYNIPYTKELPIEKLEGRYRFYISSEEIR